jgi:alkylhydroperoxidase family enzyme
VVVAERGSVTDADLARVRAAGYSDGEIGEIVANAALNIFTNYFNQVAATAIDFPVVKAKARQAA